VLQIETATVDTILGLLRDLRRNQWRWGPVLLLVILIQSVGGPDAVITLRIIVVALIGVLAEI
jgi:hypothetical protein